MVMWFLLRMLFGDPVKPLVPGSPLQAAMRKVVETLVEAGAVAGGELPEDRGQETEEGSRVGCAHHAADLMVGTAHPTTNVTKLAGYSLLHGCDPEILQDIIANGWLERFKDGGEMHRESLAAASLARENSGEFSAAAAERSESRGQGSGGGGAVSQGGSVVAATTQNVGGVREAGSADAALGEAADCRVGCAHHAPHPSPNNSVGTAHPTPTPTPPPRGSDVVGSPEWQVARAKWLKERDERVERERLQKIQERLDRDEDLRQRRAAADSQRRWLEAGRCQY